MYRIGMFSKLGKTTVKTLHHYNEVGLLRPAYVDEENGYRYYTTEQLFRLHKIVALRQMGFSIAEISVIIDGHNEEEILAQRKAELTSQKQAITDQLFRLRHYMKEQRGDSFMCYIAVIKDIPECIVFSSRQIIPNYAALMEVVPALGKKVAEANPGLTCAEPAYCFNIYHDGEHKESNIDVEICEAVTRKGKDGDSFTFKDIPAVTVASVMHKGAYEDLGAAYAYVFRWIEQNGYRAVGHPRESYIDGIWNQDSISDWLTELQVPVAKKE